VRRNKIVVGTTLLVLILLIVIAVSKGSTKELETINSGPTLEQTLAEQQKAKDYALLQQEIRKAVASYFDKAIRAGDIVGAAVSIVQGDSILISTGFGKRSINSTTKVDGETIFRLGSLSKGFGGVLAASVEAEGKLDFNDKVTDYLPEFQLGDPSNTAKIKVAHILSHSSGAPYHSFTNLVEADLSMAKIAGRFNEVAPQSEPGQQYSYQNAMFALSQEVLQKATGQDVKTSLQNRFFTPLCMTTISMNHKDLLKAENVALPHMRRKNGWKSLPLKDGYYNAVVAGGINASSLDMAKWMRFLLGHNPEVVPESIIHKAFKPFISIDYNNKYYQRWPGHLQSHYGFGWRIHTYQESANAKEKTMWHHGGSVNNYRNEIALFPDTDIGICVLLNANSRLAQTVIPDVYKIVKDNYKQSH
jgi:beta-lactamase class C